MGSLPFALHFPPPLRGFLAGPLILVRAPAWGTQAWTRMPKTGRGRGLTCTAATGGLCDRPLRGWLDPCPELSCGCLWTIRLAAVCKRCLQIVGGGGCGKSTGPAEQPRHGSPGAWFLFPQSEPELPPLEAASHGAEQGTRLQHRASGGGICRQSALAPLHPLSESLWRPGGQCRFRKGA